MKVSCSPSRVRKPNRPLLSPCTSVGASIHFRLSRIFGQLLPGTPRGTAGPSSPPILVVHTRLIDHERCPPGQYTRGLSYLVQTLAEGRERGGARRGEAGGSPRAPTPAAAAAGVEAVGGAPRLSFGDHRRGEGRGLDGRGGGDGFSLAPLGAPGALSGGREVCVWALQGGVLLKSSSHLFFFTGFFGRLCVFALWVLLSSRIDGLWRRQQQG